MGTVIVLGSLITDLVARAPRFPHPGESLVGNDFTVYLGGKGINQAVTAARMGAQVKLIGRIGNDTFGDAFLPVLQQEGIDSTYIERDQATGTGTAVIIIAEDSSQNAIVVAPRANMTMSAKPVESALKAVQNKAAQPTEQFVFLTQCETSKISYTTGLQRARALGMTTILNAAPIPQEPLESELFKQVDILIVNEVEATTLAHVPITTHDNAEKAAAILLARGPKHVIITLGEQGCLWSTQTGQDIEHQAFASIRVQTVDTTAAGDAFCGTLAASLANGQTIQTALQRANTAGAITTTRRGAIVALPTAKEVSDFLLK